MACSESTSVQVARNAWNSTRAGFSSRTTFDAVPVRGNEAVLSVTVIATTAAATNKFELQGSYNGVTWKTISSANQNSFGYATLAASAVDYAFVRLNAEISGTDQDVLFDAEIAFSSQ